MENDERKELLQSFCSDNELHKTMLHPYLHGDYVCATDAHSILLLPATEEDRQQYSEDEKKAPIMKQYLSAKTEFQSFLHIEFLKSEYDKIQMRISEIDDTCRDCKGRGTVEYEYWSEDDREKYTLNGECPVCNGTGKRDIQELITSRENRMDITPKYSFSINRLSDIIRAMGFFKKEKCTLLKECTSSGIPFHIVEPEFHLIIMPSLNNDD